MRHTTTHLQISSSASPITEFPACLTKKRSPLPWGAGNQPPVIDAIPDQAVLVGQPISIPVSVLDAIGQTIDFGATVLPPGASFPSVTGSSPLSSTFTWTPTAGDVGPNLVPPLRTAEDNG